MAREEGRLSHFPLSILPLRNPSWQGVAVDPSAYLIYISQYLDSAIRRVDLVGAYAMTACGNLGGQAITENEQMYDASFNFPAGVSGRGRKDGGRE